MLQKKSVLARLLANENISVRQGNYPTASFDVVNRVLNLPNWKDMSNDLYDMLVGHEVSHALNTPSDPEVLNIPNVPFSFVNIVEDIRIEKLIMKKYPGLVGNFTRGYDELIQMDIFGTKGKDLNELPFMDRLNIKSKGRAAVEVEFSDEEQYYFDKAMAVETFEDVREVVLELAEWLRSKNEVTEEDANQFNDGDESEDQEQGENDTGPESNEDSGEDESQEDGQGEESEEPGDEEGEEENVGSASGSDQSDEDDDEENEDREGARGTDGDFHSLIKKSSDEVDDLDEVQTDINQHNNESKLLDDSAKVFVQALSRAEYEKYTIPYSDVFDARIDMIQIVPLVLIKMRLKSLKMIAKRKRVTRVLAVKTFTL